MYREAFFNSPPVKELAIAAMISATPIQLKYRSGKTYVARVSTNGKALRIRQTAPAERQPQNARRLVSASGPWPMSSGSRRGGSPINSAGNCKSLRVETSEVVSDI